MPGAGTPPAKADVTMKNTASLPEAELDLPRFNLFLQLFVHALPAPRRRVARRR
jgi:hypothetical protein